MPEKGGIWLKKIMCSNCDMFEKCIDAMVKLIGKGKAHCLKVEEIKKEFPVVSDKETFFKSQMFIYNISLLYRVETKNTRGGLG